MKNEIASTWIRLAMLYGRNLDKGTLEMLLEAVNDLPQSEVLTELKNHAKSGTQFPLPAHLRQKIKPEIENKDEVLEAVNRAISAVSKFGYTNKLEAEIFIGQLGWKIIQGFGGWTSICENLTSENLGTIRAQLRDYGLTVYKRARSGILEEAPELPKSSEIKKITGSIKFLEE